METVLKVHFMIGVVALVSFWVTALARKGASLHRRAGKIYLLTLLGILASTLPMIRIKLQEGNFPRAFVLGYLAFLVFSASWTTWQSIRNKRNVNGYRTHFFKGLAVGLTLYGIIIFTMGLLFGSFRIFIFSLVGLVLGGSMLLMAFRKSPPPNWAWRQHLNGVAVNFAATHGSFFAFGLAKLLPVLDNPEVNTFAQTTVIMLALLLRLTLGARYLKNKRPMPGRELNVVAKEVELIRRHSFRN